MYREGKGPSRRRRVAIALAIVAIGVAGVFTSANERASTQPSVTQRHEELRKGIYEENPTFGNLPHILPGFVALALTLILVARLLGFFQMGAVGTLALVVAIAAIVYRFYWPPGQ